MRPRILFFAYACEPGRGSEPGAGWGIVRAAARFAGCTVLVSSEHAEGIRQWESSHDADIRFVQVDESRPLRAIGPRRIPRFVRYLAWLPRAREAGLRLHVDQPFDLTWHVTYATYWLPTPATEFDIPSIWGPVGGAVMTPAPLRRLLGWRGLVIEWLDAIAVRAFSRLPAIRRTWRAADVAIVQNAETLRQLPEEVRARSIVMNHALFTVPAGHEARQRRPFMRHCIIAGALEARKGVSLAIRALRYAASDVTLVVLGDGPERRRLEKLATALGLSDRVQFRGQVTRRQVAAALATARAAVFTGLREEGGLALAEAMMAGVPVIVLDHGGAGTILDSAGDPNRVARIAPGPQLDVARAIGAAMTRFVQHPNTNPSPILDSEPAVATLRQVVEQALTPAHRIVTSPPASVTQVLSSGSP